MGNQELIFTAKVGTKHHSRKGKYINNCIECGKIISSYEVCLCQSCSHIGKPMSILTRQKVGHSNEEHHNWKGNDVGYNGLHGWVIRHKPKVKYCENCGEEKKLCIANISREYKRDVDDYRWLCYLCHKKTDKEYNKLNNTGGVKWKRQKIFSTNVLEQKKE